MPTFTSILCAVDASPLALRVLKHAVGLASVFDARLTVLSVTHGNPRVAESVLRGQLASAVPAETSYPSDVSVRVVKLEMGKPVDAILDAAREGIDLLVTGTHARSDLSRWFLGSTSRALMAETTCATLLVPQGDVDIVRLDGARPVLAPGAVLAAIDLEERNDRQLALAQACAAQAGQPLVALHVVPAGGDVAAAHTALGRRVSGFVPPVKVLVGQGPVADEIDRVALAEHAGLVVMGLSERGARGAFADAVLKAKDALVLLVPSAER